MISQNISAGIALTKELHSFPAVCALSSVCLWNRFAHFSKAPIDMETASRLRVAALAQKMIESEGNGKSFQLCLFARHAGWKRRHSARIFRNTQEEQLRRTEGISAENGMPA